MTNISLYERLGGDPAIRATVAKLYDKILTDPLLTPFFVDIDDEKLRRSQAAFVTYVAGGPNRYNGKSIREAHKRLVTDKGLSDSHFDAVAGHLASALEELGVAEGLIKETLSIVETTRADVLNL
ncbi:MAG: group 1 truncated hemoglobin [Rickettsiales bacterium]|nr:group 1 truncated hemoglobin [Rickettsiales bacterium]